jgi:hypothetical protein
MAKKFIPFYNVETSVGKNSINANEDVLLVQFFLTEIVKVPPFPIPPPSTPLAVDGFPSPALEEWIWWFQNSCKQNGKIITIDGRIDSAVPHNGSIYGGHGTILHLNMSYRKRFRTAHNGLEIDPSCPGILRAKFSKDLI